MDPFFHFAEIILPTRGTAGMVQPHKAKIYFPKIAQTGPQFLVLSPGNNSTHLTSFQQKIIIFFSKTHRVEGEVGFIIKKR